MSSCRQSTASTSFSAIVQSAMSEPALRRSFEARRATHPAMPARTRIVIVAAVVAVLAGGAWLAARNAPWAHFLGAAAPLAFVSSDTCAQCHPAEAKLWRASQHKLAMAHATDVTVLGDFNDASFS